MPHRIIFCRRNFNPICKPQSIELFSFAQFAFRFKINEAMKTEFEFIENLRRRFGLSRIGDDCAVLPKDAKTDLIITADLLVEDVDFRLEWAKPEFIGHKALAVSLSDIAAMGAKPVWAMVSLGVPPKIWRTDFVEKFYEGWFALAKKHEVELVGGDVSKTPDKIVIDSIVAGETGKGKAVLRSGARVGDLIFVTGEIGGAAAGLKLLESGERYEISKHKKLLARQLKPNPQTEFGKILGAKNLATAMIDLSDGLSSDLAHLCRASKTGAKIFADQIPIDKNLRKLSPPPRDEKTATKNFSLSPLLPFSISDALNGGEDFELLFTAHPKKNFQLKKVCEFFSFHHIGEVTASAEIIELVHPNKTVILEPKGFRHF
jgi:thiamine-monophosphate kinase